jgi:hypothetical protein
VTEEEAVERGLEEKAKEFVEKGAKVYKEGLTVSTQPHEQQFARLGDEAASRLASEARQ